LLPDGKTFAALTDSPNAILLDINTFDTSGRVKWDDDLNCISGISHPHHLEDGSMLSLCSVLNDKRKPELMVWKITADKPFTR